MKLFVIPPRGVQVTTILVQLLAIRSTCPKSLHASASTATNQVVPDIAEKLALLSGINADNNENDIYPNHDQSNIINWKGQYHSALANDGGFPPAYDDDNIFMNHGDMLLTKIEQQNADLEGVFSDLSALDTSDPENAVANLKKVAGTLSLLKTSLLDHSFLSVLPPELQVALPALDREVISVEKHLNQIVEIISEHGDISLSDAGIKNPTTSQPFSAGFRSNTKRQLLDSPVQVDTGTAPSGKRYHKSDIDKADYVLRTHTHRSNEFGSAVYGDGHHRRIGPQGYFNSRPQREGGRARRRLQSDSCGSKSNSTDQKDSSKCVHVNYDDHKIEQCYRLAKCAENYNLYDMFMYFFGDDLEENGSTDQNIHAYDEADLKGKLENYIIPKSKAILEKFFNETDDGFAINAADKATLLGNGKDSCIGLLKEFHRFDEEISVKGKWQGGTVTGVCRGWGSTRFMSLESIYQISDRALHNTKDGVEKCVQDLLDDFKQQKEHFKIPDKPCLENLKLVQLGPSFKSLDEKDGDVYGPRGLRGGSEDWDELDDNALTGTVSIIKKQFDCILYSYLRAKSHHATQFAGKNPCYVSQGNKTLLDLAFFVEDSIPLETADPKEYLFDVPDNFFNSSKSETVSISSVPQKNATCPIPKNIESCGDFTSTLNCTVNDERQNVLECCGEVDKMRVRCKESPFYAFNLAELNMKQTLLNLAINQRSITNTSLVQDASAENFIIDVFEEFIGCAHDIGTVILRNSEQILFSGHGNQLTNPFTPDHDKLEQLKLPIRLQGVQLGGKDEYGKLISKYLDEIMKYVKIGDVGEGEILEGAHKTKISEKLRSRLVKDHADAHYASLMVEYFGKSDTPEIDFLKNGILYVLKEKKRKEFERVLEKYVSKGKDRSALDTSIALLFGNETSIGQICSYAKGLKDGKVDNLPGFCCLDAPYEDPPPDHHQSGGNWGELFECQEYYEDKGFTKLRAKGPTKCRNLAPFTAGFNEAACDVFSGTWCPMPRDCKYLRECVKTLKKKAGLNGDKQAFFEYLDSAPAIKDEGAEDPEECGRLREYFEYDENFPDDVRICKELEDLQCLTDFSNLDGFATGARGDGGGDKEELAVSYKIRVSKDLSFDSIAAKVWRSSNFVLKKAVDIARFVADLLDESDKLCISMVSMFAGTAAPCATASFLAGTVAKTILFAVECASSISEKIYDEIVNKKHIAAHITDMRESINENVVTIFGNVNTVFAATQQLKVMLGEVADNLERFSEDDEEERRRLAENCQPEDNCSRGDCECEDPTRNCDCSFDFVYISELRGAGCDGLDSDGNGCKDDCEDRFPPDLVTTNAEIFRCDDDDTKRLCYTEQVFQTDQQARNFLDFHFRPVDDCQASNKLGVEITSSGTCRETKYTLKPFQNITGCPDDKEGVGYYNIKFESVKKGIDKHDKNVTLQVDEEDPEITCGFHDVDHINVVENKTLFYYVHDGEDPDELADTNFFYNVTDNCPADIDIDIVIESNEYEHDEMASLVKLRKKHFVEQPRFFFRPNTCDKTNKFASKGSKKSSGCEGDFSVPINLRFYDVTVTAIDAAGRVGQDTCRVIIVPECQEKSTKSPKSPGKHCENLHYHHGSDKEHDHNDLNNANHTHDTASEYRHLHGIYYKLEYVSALVEASDQRFTIKSMNFLWNSSLRPPFPIEVDEDLDDEQQPPPDPNIAELQSSEAFLPCMTTLPLIFTVGALALNMAMTLYG